MRKHIRKSACRAALRQAEILKQRANLDAQDGTPPILAICAEVAILRCFGYGDPVSEKKAARLRSACSQADEYLARRRKS